MKDNGGCLIIILVAFLSISSCSSFSRIEKKLERIEQQLQSHIERTK